MRQDGLPHATARPPRPLASLVALGLLGVVRGLRATGVRELRAEGREPAGENVSETRQHPVLGPPGVAGSMHIGSGTDLLREINGTAKHFSSCTQACDQCFDDHYQGCLAFCRIGCEDYCTEKLPRPQCERNQEWVAQVGHVFQALDAKAVMCQVTGPNGCPDPPMLVMPTPVPFEPYNAAKVGGDKGAGLHGFGAAVRDEHQSSKVNTTEQAELHGADRAAEGNQSHLEVGRQS